MNGSPCVLAADDGSAGTASNGGADAGTVRAEVAGAVGWGPRTPLPSPRAVANARAGAR